jgi:Porin subfamily
MNNATAPVGSLLAIAAMATLTMVSLTITPSASAQTATTPTSTPKAPSIWSVPAAKSTPVKRAEPCPVYGEGFVKLPGSDTCVRLGGYVRIQAGVNR